MKCACSNLSKGRNGYNPIVVNVEVEEGGVQLLAALEQLCNNTCDQRVRWTYNAQHANRLVQRA